MSVDERVTVDEEVLQVLQEWKKESDSKLQIFVGVDIGGTNCRVAVENGTPGSKYQSKGADYLLIKKFAASRGKTLLSGLQQLGEQVNKVLGVQPVGACLDAAGPIKNQGTEVTITNYTAEKDLKKEDLPASLFPANTLIINDLAATCEGINALSQSGSLSQYFEPLWGPSLALSNGKLKAINYIVMAAGTGLGCGLLLAPTNKSESHRVIPLEFGHTTLTPAGSNDPDYQEEQALLHMLSEKIYQKSHSIEWEDICSGRGIQNCWQFATRERKDTPPHLEPVEIVKRAMGPQPDPAAQQALFLHYKYLFRAGCQQSVAFIAKGLLLAGGNQVANDSFVSSHAEEFRKEYEKHSKGDWVKDNSVHRQVKMSNMNLFGCLFVAKRIANQ